MKVCVAELRAQNTPESVKSLNVVHLSMGLWRHTAALMGISMEGESAGTWHVSTFRQTTGAWDGVVGATECIPDPVSDEP